MSPPDDDRPEAVRSTIWQLTADERREAMKPRPAVPWHDRSEFGFAEIADALAVEPGRVKPDPGARSAAMRKLIESLRMSEFDSSGGVGWRAGNEFNTGLTADDFVQMERAAASAASNLYEQFYLSRDQALRWFTIHGLPVPGGWFRNDDVRSDAQTNEPLQQAVQQSSAAIHKPSSPAASYRTGAPGRPSPRHLVERELKRRLEAGAVLSTLTAEAKHLAGWLRAEHPLAHPLTPKSIENSFRNLYRSAPKLPPKISD